jgi:hypothetical protein
MPQEYVSEELTHFIGRSLASQDEQFKLLVHILRSRWLQASYRMEFGAGSYLRGEAIELQRGSPRGHRMLL